jgi:hypothetical protein
MFILSNECTFSPARRYIGILDIADNYKTNETTTGWMGHI